MLFSYGMYFLQEKINKVRCLYKWHTKDIFLLQHIY